jgi:hypothetical protein
VLSPKPDDNAKKGGGGDADTEPDEEPKD